MLRHFVETRLPQQDPFLSGKLQCFYMVCKAVDTILYAKRGLIPMAEAGARLRACLQEYLALHKVEYGQRGVKPKTHWAFDIADQLMQDKGVIDAFVIERLHLRVRAIADNVKGLSTFSSSVLSGVVNYHSHTAQSCIPGCGLSGKTFVPKGHPDVLLSDHIDIGGKTFSVSDFVARGDELGLVIACCVEGLDLFVIVDLWGKVAQISQHSSRWVGMDDRRAVWRAADMLECLMGASFRPARCGHPHVRIVFQLAHRLTDVLGVFFELAHRFAEVLA